MAFLLKNVVPWGRNLSEYQEMFGLTNEDILTTKIISFGDGPASFNTEGTKMGGHILSLDPIYQFSKQKIEERLLKTRDVVMDQTRRNVNNYKWDRIKDPSDLENIRMSAMTAFLDDYEGGLSEKRYLYHELPRKTKFKKDTFDIGLSSHFLFLYTSLGLDFHIQSINEMLRICKEVRIFPILNLDGCESALSDQVMRYCKKNYTVEIRSTDYEFLKHANKMMVITH